MTDPFSPESQPPSGPPESTPPPPLSGPPPGWYTDPQRGTGLRFWNGVAWTDQVADLPPGTPGSGLPPVGSWMGQSFRLAVRRAGHVFPLVVVLLVPAYAAFGFVSFQSLNGIRMVQDVDLEYGIAFEGYEDKSVVLPVLVWLLAMVAQIVLGTALARHFAAASGDDPVAETWSRSLAGGLRRLPAVAVLYLVTLGLMVALLVPTALAGLVHPALGVLVFLCTVPAFFWLAARLFLGVMAAAAGARPFGAAQVAFALSRGRVMAMLGRLLLLAVVSMGLSFVGSMVAAPFTAGFGTSVDMRETVIDLGDILGGSWAVAVFAQTISALSMGAAVAVVSAGTALIYRSLEGPVDPELATPVVV